MRLAADGGVGQVAWVPWFLVSPLGVMFVVGVALAVSCLARLAGVPALRIRRVLMVVGVLWFALYALALVAGFMFAAWLWGSNWAF